MVLDVNDALSVIMTETRHKDETSYFYEENLKENLSINEMIVHLDYSENYKSTQQNDIQSPYFGNTLVYLPRAFTIVISWQTGIFKQSL